MPRAWTRPATPRPVPGPSTTRPASGSGVAAADLLHVLLAERHDGQRLRLEIVEHDDVLEAEVVEHRPSARTTQGQLVRAISSPSTGPATASTAERGRSEVWSRMADLDRLVDGGEVGGLARSGRTRRLGIGVRARSRSAHWCRRCRRSGSETATTVSVVACASAFLRQSPSAPRSVPADFPSTSAWSGNRESRLGCQFRRQSSQSGFIADEGARSSRRSRPRQRDADLGVSPGRRLAERGKPGRR